jgi:protein-S-isoprenylcysteine O-methyltransferase Ste14
VKEHLVHTDAALTGVLRAALGFVLVYAATLLLNHFHLLGLSQAYRGYVMQVPDATSDRLQVHGPYRVVRHPLMTGLLLYFWCASTFTAGKWCGQPGRRRTSCLAPSSKSAT